MKKVYVSPKTIITCSFPESELLGHSYEFIDAKKQSFFDEEADAQDEVAPTDKSTWDDEKNWD